MLFCPRHQKQKQILKEKNSRHCRRDVFYWFGRRIVRLYTTVKATVRIRFANLETGTKAGRKIISSNFNMISRKLFTAHDKRVINIKICPRVVLTACRRRYGIKNIALDNVVRLG